ncbi:hypothetical protein AB0383_41300 [Amycolatopsis sp. NPDC051373]|uniref:hypothetical protein n=1 Tax=Amycolatopsis sp. NPDC051373 TaxID=3155801 RepID=UPI00344E1EEE
MPDDARLTARLEAEHLLVFCTEGDSRREHLAAGAVCARTWLEATARGLAESVLTQRCTCAVSASCSPSGWTCPDCRR